MSETPSKIKNNYQKVVLYASLFLAVFFSLFYLVNLDIRPIQNKAIVNSNIAPSVDLTTEFKNKLGSTTFSMESYADWAGRFGLDNSNNGLDSDPDKDGLPNYLEYIHGTNPLNSDSDGDKFSDKQEIINGYDPDAPGDTKPIVEVTISKINVEAPMVWSLSEDEKNMLSDLENGLSHFYKTAAPGQNGNSIISGHSSNYIWAKGDYNHIFKDLNILEAGDVVTIKTIQQNGRVIVYSYKITDKFVTSADDARIFAATSDPTLTLSTCWPIGTNLKRLIIKAELVK
jgi:LPXTG-site transpeptidase (sortase) family protein